jgi:hypothetical protein
MRIAPLARGLLALGLVALILVALRGESEGETFIVTSETPATVLADALASTVVSVPLEYADSIAPTREISVLLAGAAHTGRSVALNVPATLPALEVDIPQELIAQRRAALRVRIRAEPSSEATLYIDDPSGATDSVLVRIDADGFAEASVAIEPARTGVATWTVRAGPHAVTAHARVLSEQPVRVLLLTEAAEWESRYLVRALEAAGAAVSVHQQLGRDQIVASDQTSRPSTLDELSAWDVVAVAGAVSAATERLLSQWVSERGGGLLLVSGAAPSAELAQWAAISTPVSRPAEDLEWAGPVEIVPLPASDLSPRMVTLPAGGSPVAWSRNSGGSESVHARADWVGRGRIFSSGFESWPWVMEVGQIEGHRRYWESVVEWLASGLTRDVVLAGQPGLANVAWDGRLQGMGAAAQIISTRAQQARVEVLYVPGHTPRVRTVPTETGVHPITVGERDFGMISVDATERTSWTGAALEIGSRGGTVAAASGSLTPPTPWNRTLLRWLAFLLLAALASIAWAARRLAGLA